ncbi:MAG: winged helix-turn-helix transcriptional regulator [Candidatus Korarchaeota archaeon]|nr:winged helix-turn-helix transcriptional regulator [Candidatus Korarchaeota archaeon]
MRLLARLILAPALALLISLLLRVPIYLIHPDLGDVSFVWLLLALIPSLFFLLGGSKRWAARLFAWVTLAFWGLASTWGVRAVGGPVAAGTLALVLLGALAYVLAELGRLGWAVRGLGRVILSSLGLAWDRLRVALNLPLGGEEVAGYLDAGAGADSSAIPAKAGAGSGVGAASPAGLPSPGGGINLSPERVARLDRDLARLDISARRVLEVLLAEDGLSKSEIARRANIGRRHAIRAISELEELGWVESRRGRVDTRGGSRLATLVFLMLSREERAHVARRLEELKREGRTVF